MDPSDNEPQFLTNWHSDNLSPKLADMRKRERETFGGSGRCGDGRIMHRCRSSLNVNENIETHRICTSGSAQTAPGFDEVSM